MFNNMLTNSTIKILNLSRNKITDYSGLSLGKIITENCYLDQIYLRWN